MAVVSFTDFEVTPRYDDIPWSQRRIAESATKDGPWTIIDTQAIDPVDPNPADPAPQSFSTENATLDQGWYRVTFLDTDGNQLVTDPVYNNQSVEIMASLDDINANLDGSIVSADSNNTALIQVSVARVVRGYLSRVVSAATMAAWTTPENTPDIVREAAAKLIAAQLYFNEMSKTSTVIEPTHYAQKLYDEAMALLNQIIEGDIIIPDIVVTPIESLTDLDYFPVDDTDRAFSMGMNL